MRIDYNDFDILYTKNNGYYECYIYDLYNVVKLNIDINLCKEKNLKEYILNNYRDIFSQ